MRTQPGPEFLDRIERVALVQLEEAKTAEQAATRRRVACESRLEKIKARKFAAELERFSRSKIVFQPADFGPRLAEQTAVRMADRDVMRWEGEGGRPA